MTVDVLVLSDLWQPFPGGAERLLFNLARDLDRRPEFAVRVLTGYENAQRFDGPPVCIDVDIGVGLHHQKGQEAIARFIERTGTPDVILTHHLYAYEFESELAETGIPFVQVVHNTRRIPGAAFAVFNSDYSAHRVGRYPGDLIITPPAYDDVIADTDVPPYDREFIGFMKPIEHKGVELVYQIAEAMPDREFLILRGEWQTLETLCDHPNVTYLDPVDQIAEFYARCSVVLMPSISEDAGTVGQECAANGIPCVSSNAGGLRQTNAGGVRLDTRSPTRWVDAILGLDHPATYQRVVEQQWAALVGTRQGEQMDKLAAKIAGLA